MQIVQNTQGVFNTPSEGNTLTSPAPSSSYSVKSITTSEGNRAHTVATRNRALANAFYGAALNVDDTPLNGKSQGLYRVDFYCSDDECQSVIAAAQGAKA